MNNRYNVIKQTDTILTNGHKGLRRKHMQNSNLAADLHSPQKY